MNQWAGSCDSCLGNDKPYWITEWGQFGESGISNFTEGATTYNYTGDFSNTFVDAAYAFQFLLEMTDYDAGLGGSHLADIDYMIKHNYMSNSLGGAINPPVGIDDTSNAFIRRANYWPFFIMQDIYNKGYERVNTSVELLSSETRTPFIKCFYYDNPATMILPTNFCSGGGQGTGGTVNPVFYMYFYNPYHDDITFKHAEMTGIHSETLESFSPTSGQAAFKKFIEVDELYEHAGRNRYMNDNAAYTSPDVVPEIDGISQEVIHLCEGDSIVLPGYSFGYVYWEITPDPFREGLFTENTLHKVWPVPAEKTAYIQLTLPNEEDLYTLHLFSISGELVQQKDFSASGYDEIERDDLSAGIYFYSITNQTGLEIVKGKLIWE